MHKVIGGTFVVLSVIGCMVVGAVIESTFGLTNLHLYVGWCILTGIGLGWIIFTEG